VVEVAYFGRPGDPLSPLLPSHLTQLLDQVQNALGDVFRIENELTGGGMSRLFIAIESSLNRRVVIKVLPPEWASEVSAARFKREMEFAAQLQHPHILPVLAAGARENLLYYIMPYVDGESLRARLKRDGPFAIADATRILSEVADALAYAHQRGVIHRDIKPENILLEGRHAVLADFGVARAVLEARTGDRLTATGMAVGTPGYMSPEQVAGDTVDARADVYALAIVGYELLTGEQPFTGSSAQAILTAHLTQAPPPVASIRKGTPANVSDAIARTLSKDPAQRLTATEFGEALATEHASSPRRAFTRETSRILLAIMAMFALGVAGFAWMRSNARSSALVARVTPAADSSRYNEVFHALDSAGASLDSRQLAAVATKVGGRLAIATEPAGAEVFVTRVHPLSSLQHRRPVPLGRTPVAPKTLVAGEYLVRVMHQGAEPLDVLADVALGKELALRRRLNTDSSRRGMSLVDAGSSPTGRTVDAFYIDRNEVTNAQFHAFVAAGGYRDARYWPDTMYIGARPVLREAALHSFVDKTGLPGPRLWSGAKFPDGKGDHPVVGVSWYEATAYAQWARKRLPSQDEWWRAALGAGEAPFPWGQDGATVDVRANFGLDGTKAVGSYPAGVSPYGCYDMAGNVREWLSDFTVSAGRSRNVVAGGSWQDPSYMFEMAHMEHFDPSFASAAVGFRLAQSAATARPPSGD
jgi:formylglycine-generating enzyme required for sulfatase activity